MKTDNFNHAEKVLVLGAGQLGAAVLDALVACGNRAPGHGLGHRLAGAWDEAGQLRSANHQALATPEPPSSPSTSPVAPWRRWPISFADSPP